MNEEIITRPFDNIEKALLKHEIEEYCATMQTTGIIDNFTVDEPWLPINKGHVKYSKRKVKAILSGKDGQIHIEEFRSGRYAKKWLKRNWKNIIISDVCIKPFKPLEYIELNFTVEK